MASITDLSRAECFEIIRGKDASWDGQFIFAVRTTGVYCRPSCPARTPLERNVEYFGDARAAERAGYRACLRCRPNDVARLEAAREAWVAEWCRRLEDGEADLSLTRLAHELGRTPSSVSRAFKAAVGLTPKEYATAVRERRLRRALREPGTVTRAGYAAGYGSSGRLYADVDRSLGMSPQRYKAAGAGEIILYATAPCALGFVLVARTQRGVCAVALGDDPAALVGALRVDFARADVRLAHDGLLSELRAVLHTLDTGAPAPDLPLDIRGTAFQHRVWRALCAIPSGETCTYAELAARVDAPNAVRAVGSACGANRLAAVVPCHRVLRTDGQLGGYRWGLDNKRRLLEREAELTQDNP